MRKIVVIAHNVRSCHNVGSLLRTCEGMGVACVYFTGYTPYPAYKSDIRLPHVAKRATNQIEKTALGADKLIRWSVDEIYSLIKRLKLKGYSIVALEQSPQSVALHNFKASNKTAVILGNELTGVDGTILNECDHVVEILMKGNKESFNVSIAAAIALYHILHI